MTNCLKAIALLSFLISIINFNIFGQKQEPFNQKIYVQWLRDSKEELNAKVAVSSLTEAENLSLCTIIKDNMNDSIFDVRWRSISLGSIIGSSSKSEQVRREVISIMLHMMYDLDSRIIYFASQNLQELNSPKYSASQKDTILYLVTQINNPSILVTLYRICGEQSIKESIPLLEEVGFSSNIPFYQRWIALASLTRLGHTEAEETMHAYLNRMGISLDAVKMLYPHVLFSRSTKNVGLLIDFIENNDSGCESSNPNVTTSIPCAYLILTEVAPEIAGIKWEGRDGLQALEPEEALKKARQFFKSIDNNWSFISE